MLQAQFRSKRLGEENSQPHKLTKNRNGVLVFWHKKHFRRPLVSLREWSGREGIEAHASCFCGFQYRHHACVWGRAPGRNCPSQDFSLPGTHILISMAWAAGHVKPNDVLAEYWLSGFLWWRNRWQAVSFLHVALKSYYIIKRTDVNLLWHKAPNAVPYWALIVTNHLLFTSNKCQISNLKAPTLTLLEKDLSQKSSWPFWSSSACIFFMLWKHKKGV